MTLDIDIRRAEDGRMKTYRNIRSFEVGSGEIYLTRANGDERTVEGELLGGHR